MAATVVGIIYSINQQVIREVIHTRWLGYDINNNPIIDPNADDKSLIPHKLKMLPGEAWVTIPIEIYDTHTHPLQTHQYLGLTGIPGVTDRCIAHDGKSVKSVVFADPSIDKHPTYTLAQDITGQANVGHSVINGVAIIPS